MLVSQHREEPAAGAAHWFVQSALMLHLAEQPDPLPVEAAPPVPPVPLLDALLPTWMGWLTSR